MIGRYIDLALVDIDWYIDTDIVINRCAHVCVKESQRVCECMCLIHVWGIKILLAYLCTNVI